MAQKRRASSAGTGKRHSALMLKKPSTRKKVRLLRSGGKKRLLRSGGKRRIGGKSQAYNRSYDIGFDEAYNEGFNAGYQEGLSQGFEDEYKGGA